MPKDPFDLSFEDLAQIARDASSAAIDEARLARVPIASLEVAPGNEGQTKGWTDGRIQALRRYWLEGLSSGQIAARLGGVSRSAVLRKIHGLGLTGRDASTPLDAACREALNARAGSIVALGSHMCKWPIGDPAQENFTFCGQRIVDGSYCAEHARLAYGATNHKKSSNRLPKSLKSVTLRQKRSA